MSVKHLCRLVACAVLGLVCAPGLFATQSVNINIVGGAGSLSGGSITSGLSAGVVEVEATGWNQVAEMSSTSSVSLTNQVLEAWNGTEMETTPMRLTVSANNCYAYSGSAVTGNGLLMKGYLDDGGSGPSISVSNIPYTSYDVYVYAGTDQTSSGSFEAITVNGTAYPNTDGTVWGSYTSTHESDGSITLTENTNYIKVSFTNTDGATVPTTITVATYNTSSNSNRIGLAGVQIVNTGSDVSYLPSATFSIDATDSEGAAKTNLVSTMTSDLTGDAVATVNGDATLTVDADITSLTSLTLVAGTAGSGTKPTLKIVSTNSTSICADDTSFALTAYGVDVDWTNYANNPLVTFSGTGDITVRKGSGGIAPSVSGFSGTLTVDDGQQITRVTTPVAVPVTIGSGGAVFHNNSNVFQWTGKISGSGPITFAGSGTTSITNSANDFTGDATVNEGAVYVGNLASESSGTDSTFGASTSTITVKSGASLYTHLGGSDKTFVPNITLESGSTLGNRDGNVTLSGNISIAGDVNYINYWRKTNVFSGVVSGEESATLTLKAQTAESGTSTITLSNASNTFAGTYAVTGTDSSHQMGLLSSSTAAGSATVSLANEYSYLTLTGDATVKSLAGSGTVQSDSEGTARALTLSGAGSDAFTGTLTSDINALTIAEGATWVCEGSVDAGTTITNNGTLTIPSTNATNTITVGANATLKIQLTEVQYLTEGFTTTSSITNNGTVVLLGADGAELTTTTNDDGTISYKVENVATWTNGAWSATPTDGGAAVIDFASVTTTSACVLNDSSITSLSVLTIKGSGTVNVNSTLTVGTLVVDTDATSAVTFNNSAQLTVTNSISGSAALNITATDTSVSIQNPVIVDSASYTGAVTLSGGTINWGNNSGGTSVNTDYTFGSSLTIGSGATFNIHPWTTAARDNSITDKVTFNTPITLNGGTLKTEDGSYYFKSTITVAADSTFNQGWDKGVVIEQLAGTGAITWTAAMGNGTGGAFTCFRYASTSGKVTMNNTGTGASAWTIRLDSDQCFANTELAIEDSSATLTFGNARNVGMLTGSCTLSGTATFTIKGISGSTETGTFSGTITNTPITLGTNSPSWTFTGSLGSSNTYSSAITLNSGSTLTLSPSAATTLSGTISGAGALVVDGSNAVTLTGYNTSFTGSTTVNSGATLKVLTTNYSVDDSYKALPDNHSITVNGTLDLAGFFGYVNITGTGTLQVSGTANLGFGSGTNTDDNNSYNVATVTVDSGATLNFPTWRAVTFSPTTLTVNGTITKATGDSALSMEVPTGNTWTLNSGNDVTTLPDDTSVNVLGTLELDSGTSILNLTGSGTITTKTGSSSYYVLGVTDDVTIAVENVVVPENSNLGILDTSTSGKTITLTNLTVNGELKKADASTSTPTLVLTGKVTTTTTDDTAGIITNMPVTFQNATLVITTYNSLISHIGQLQSVTFDGTLNVTMPSSSVSGSILSLASDEIAEPSAYNVTLATDGSALPYARVMASTIVKTDLLITNYQPSTEGTVSEVMKGLDSGSLDKILDGAKTWALLYGSTTIESITGQTKTGTTGGTLGTTDINNALTVFDNIVTVTPTGSESGSPLSAVVSYDFGISSMVVNTDGDIVVTAKVQGANAATAAFASGTTVTLTVGSTTYDMEVGTDGTATATVKASDLTSGGTTTMKVTATNTSSTSN